MGKRLTVKYIGETEYRDVKLIPVGTEFKATEATDYGNGVLGVYIRGTNLAKAADRKDLFKAKQYLFVIGRKNSEFEVVL